MKKINPIRSNLVVVVVVLFWIGGLVSPVLAQDEGDWDFFKSSEGRFSMRVPTKPVVTTTEKDSFIGTITNHIFTVLRKDHYEKFTVDYSEIPHFAVEFTGADTIMDHAKGAILSQTMSKPVSYTDITVDGFKGKRLVYDAPPRAGHPALRGEAIIVMVGDRLYVVDAQLPVENHSAKAKRFLGSIAFDKS